MRTIRRSHRSPRRGTSLLMAIVLAMIGSVLCAAIMTTVTTRVALARASRAAMVATQIADSGLSVARAELRAKRDADQDGLGTVSGTLGAGTFRVSCTRLTRDQYRLVSTARFDVARKTIESIVVVTRSNPSMFGLGLFGDQGVEMRGNCVTDGFDSGEGTYESQAVREDRRGSFALGGSRVGSNGSVVILGSESYIRGDVTPGSGGSVNLHGGGTVAGSTAPRKSRVNFPAIDTSELFDARGRMLPSATDTSAWQKKGKVILSGGNVVVGRDGELTIPGGTYYLLSLRIGFGGVVRVTGPARLYVRTQIAAERGTLINESGVPAGLQIFGLGDNALCPTDNMKLLVKDGLSAAIYAPKMDVTFYGGGPFTGAAVARTVHVQRGSPYRFDVALGRLPASARFHTVKQISWRRIATPADHAEL